MPREENRSMGTSGRAAESSLPARMRALRIHARGDLEQLFVGEAPLPPFGPEDVLVRVCATGITPAELSWDATYQHPDGSSRLPSIPGHEVSGVVAALGAKVNDLKAGDAVYGLTDFFRDGAAAQFVAVAAGSLAAKPETVDDVRTAATPLSALTAWQALFVHGQLAAGQQVLIHGAAGGVGSFAVQLARWRGAYVLAAASAADGDFLDELGADEVIDYGAGPFESRLRGVDLVLDTIGDEIRRRSWPVLKPGGVLITLGAPIPPGEAEKFNAGGIFFIVEPSREQLNEISGLIDSSKLRPVVSQVLPLDRGAEAFAPRSARGHRRGKTVVQVRE